MSAPPRPRPATGLLEGLVQVVRPEFRAEVFCPPNDSPVFYRGPCRIPACPVAISYAARRLCEGHYQQWKQASARPGGADFTAWLAAEDQRTRQRETVAACALEGCNRAVKSHRLCHRHAEHWMRARRPELAGWLATTGYTPTWAGERDCRFLGCARWTDGPEVPLCRSHYERWRRVGRPAVQEWAAELARLRDPHVRLHGLGRQLRLEVQFGLQCRYDEGVKLTAPRVVTRAVGWARHAGVVSLLDWTERQWRQFIDPQRRSRDVVALRFLLDTRFRLEALLIGEDPWADQYPRDTWDLHHLGLRNEDVRYLRFEAIPQPWLRELVKRWCRWRLGRGIVPATAAIDVAGCVSLAHHLGRTAGPDAPAAALTRAVIESWLAALQTQRPRPDSRRHHIHSVGGFLKDVHRHGWEPALPAGAFVYDDAPPRQPPTPRWIPERLMRQLEDPANLARFPSDDGRVLLQLLMACGLRLKDARHLRFDCVVRDNAQAPYLAWINHKVGGRMAFFPLSDPLAETIAGQQRRVLDRFPSGCPWLFPAHQGNLDGRRPSSDRRFRDQLAAWLERIHLVDEHGRPARVTCHQFRHTLGTRLINANVPQHVVQQLLDHMSPQMTAVYARLHDDTVRKHWEAAVKVNADGQTVDLPVSHPLADAAWMRLSMVRAKVTLPNGYCGAPIQTDCEFANPCLDCGFFITTGDFLDQHRRQREETAKLIGDAEQANLSRIAEKNTRTLRKLDTIIDALEHTGPDQIVAGGRVEDLHATS